MNEEKYNLKTEVTHTQFEFISEGPRGAIRKVIEFQPTTQEGLFNLAFGDKVVDGGFDDLAVSDNGDTDKVLATVISALYAFFDRHPSAFVYASGSTKARTRLYRVGITRFMEEMQRDFYLYGQIGDEFPSFEKGIDYDGFLAQRKKN